MPSRPCSVPKYRHYKPKKLAVVRLNGKDHYLGKFGSPPSYELYDRLIAEWLARDRQPESPTATSPRETTVNELLLAFLRHAQTYYVKHGRATSELSAYKCLARVLRKYYGSLSVSEFGPLALKAVRGRFIEAGLSRVPINLRIARIKRVFAWGVAEELVPCQVSQALDKVRGLRRGKTKALESVKVKPVELDHVRAVLPFLSPQVSAMVQVQLLTGMRPGEVVRMRPRDIDRSRAIWKYEPADHKTIDYEKERPIYIGPKAQTVLLPFLDRIPDAHMFSPREAEEHRQMKRAENRQPDRKTKIYPCELRAREKRKKARSMRHGGRRRRDHYDVSSYRQAVEYGLEMAKKNGISIPHWHPNQLRHTRATEIREAFGIEAAQAVLGHANMSITEVYAEKNYRLASDVALKTG